MTIADKIYELRSSRNMSLREFAQLAGVTHTTIARLEADTFGTQKVYLDTLYQICKNLNSGSCGRPWGFKSLHPHQLNKKSGKIAFLSLFYRFFLYFQYILIY